MFKGSFPAFLFYAIGATFAILSIIIIYYQSQYYHQQRPFPHQWISKVAQHYPQFIVFRSGTITGAVLIILGWFTNHFYLKTVCLNSGINLKKYRPEIPLIMGTMGGLFLMGNTATIDTGFMNQKAHEFCARNFFLFTLLAQIYCTIILAILSTKTTAINKLNIYVKYIVIALLVLQVVDSAIKGYGWFGEEGMKDENSDKDKFLEWTLTATVISFFLSIGFDANQYEFVYTDVSVGEGGRKQREGDRMSQISSIEVIEE